MILTDEDIERLLLTAKTGQMKFMTEKPPRDGYYIGSMGDGREPNIAWPFFDGKWWHTWDITSYLRGGKANPINGEARSKFVWYTNQPELLD